MGYRRWLRLGIYGCLARIKSKLFFSHTSRSLSGAQREGSSDEGQH